MFDFLYYSFNPNYPEVLFNFIREGDDENEIFGIGTYNYATNNFEVLDSLAGQPGGKAPACAPDGLKIAFLHQSRLYIVYRSGTP